MSEVGEILSQASAILDARGWCQNTLRDDAGAVCAYGAINTAVFNHAHNSRSRVGELTKRGVDAALYDHLPQEYQDKDETKRACVVNYNNAHKTTVTDIKDLFAKTIADEGIVL